MSETVKFLSPTGGRLGRNVILSYGRNGSFYATYGKRIVDLALVLASLPALIPFLGGVVCLRLLQGRRCFSLNVRIGQRGTRFRMVGLGGAASGLGLDRLPMLWNVVKGDMSLIGPRPMTDKMASCYYGAAYFHVRPGLIDPKELRVSAGSCAANNVCQNAEYVMKQGLFYDLFILCRYCCRS